MGTEHLGPVTPTYEKIAALEAQLAAATERAEKAEADCAALREAFGKPVAISTDTASASIIKIHYGSDEAAHKARVQFRAALASPHPGEKLLAVVPLAAELARRAEKQIYPQPDKPESDYAVLKRLQEALAALNGDGRKALEE